MPDKSDTFAIAYLKARTPTTITLKKNQGSRSQPAPERIDLFPSIKRQNASVSDLLSSQSSSGTRQDAVQFAE
jgi:hypothetical protein